MIGFSLSVTMRLIDRYQHHLSLLYQCSHIPVIGILSVSRRKTKNATAQRIIYIFPVLQHYAELRLSYVRIIQI